MQISDTGFASFSRNKNALLRKTRATACTVPVAVLIVKVVQGR